MAVAIIGRGHVYLVRLDSTLGSDIKKTRPCVVVSPDELNGHLRTVIVAPMTTGGRAYPWRPRCRFQGRAEFVALDQVRTVEVAGTEASDLGRFPLEALDHLRRTDADGEGSRQHGTSGEPDVGVELVGLAVDEEIVESLQTTELEAAARDGTPGEHQRNLGIALASLEVALLNDGDSHRSLNQTLEWQNIDS